MIIIPAIDIIDGKCVRLTKGDYNTKKVYNEDPVEVAKSFEGAGIINLHVVDLDGAKAKSPQNLKIIEKICSSTNLKVDMGGGLSAAEHIDSILNAGVAQFTIGSIAAKNRALTLEWLKIYGSEKLILGADCKNELIMTGAWEESSNLSVFEFINDYKQQGVQYVICTDVSKDGMLAGPSTGLYKEILQNNDVKLRASGGISNVQDVEEMEEIGCHGCIIGKAFYEGKISLKQLSALC